LTPTPPAAHRIISRAGIVGARPGSAIFAAIAIIVIVGGALIAFARP
jgi:hypothetical protein